VNIPVLLVVILVALLASTAFVLAMLLSGATGVGIYVG
jgi:hypothetical protein